MARYRFDPADYHADPARKLDGNAPTDDQSDFELFMIAEGFDLLASFRALPDRNVRDAIRIMLAGLAAHHTEKQG